MTNSLLILYHSEHHQNTKKLVEGLAKECSGRIHLVDLSTTQVEQIDCSQYQTIGFASGVYFSKLHQSLYDAVQKLTKVLQGRNVLVLYTCGSGGKKYAQDFTVQLTATGANVLGVYHCKGYDTYGPFKLIGGVAKGHPSQEDIAESVRFVQQVC